MIVLENGDVIEGDATNASEVDFTIHGLDNNALKQLADGQLANSKGTIFTADSTDVISSVILVNTGAAHNHVNLYLKPSGGTSRRLIPKDLQLEVGYSLHFDGAKVMVLSNLGNIIYSSANPMTAAEDMIIGGTGGVPTRIAVGEQQVVGRLTGGSVKGLSTSELTGLIPAASTSAAGKVEIATAAETTTGNDADRCVSPDGLAGSDYGKRIVQIKVVDDATALATGDGKVIFCIPPELNGYNLVDADAFVTTVSSSGTPIVQLRNVTDSVDMLSTRITIDANEYTSYTAAAAPVIDTDHDDVATGDLIAIDVDGAGTGAKGLGVTLTFQLP